MIHRDRDGRALLLSNALGEHRSVGKVWPDGSFSCPFCGCAVLPTDEPCPNPMCDAHPRATGAEILKRRADRAEVDARIAERGRLHVAAMDSQRAWNDRQAAEINEAVEAGYCLRCFVRSGHRRRVRHRTPDYHETS